jgi:hypothetical protein
MNNMNQTIKVLFWSTVAVIDIALILGGGLCFAIVGTAIIAYIYYLATPLIISFIVRKMKGSPALNLMIDSTKKSLQVMSLAISSTAASHSFSILKKMFYALVFICDLILFYIVFKDKQNSNELFRLHLGVLSYFIIMPICLKLKWILYLAALTFSMLVFYFKLPFGAVLPPFLIVVFAYTIYTVFADNQHRIGTLSLKLALLPLLFIGSFYLILEAGLNRVFNEEAGDFFLWITIIYGIIFSTILFILGLVMKVTGLVQRKAEYL